MVPVLHRSEYNDKVSKKLSAGRLATFITRLDCGRRPRRFTIDKITVFHLRCSNYPGGPETTLLGWYKYADRTRFDPRILFFSERRGLHERSLKLFADHSVPVECIPWGASRNLPGSVFKLIGMIRKARPCVLHAHDVRSDFVALVAGRMTNTPVVISNHAWHAVGLKREIQEGLRARWLPYADIVINVSEDTHRETLRRGVPPEKSIALYSGLDLEPYRRLPSREDARARLGIPLDAPVISNVARTWPEKAIDKLIEAAARLRPKYPGLRVLQVGDGVLDAELKADVERRGLQDCVHLLGFHTDYIDMMRASDVFALPSLAEGMPMVIYSAMAMGMPIVASDVSGLLDTLEHEKTALMIRPGNADDLTAALDAVLADPALARRIGAEAQRVMEARFSAEVAVRQLETIYNEKVVETRRQAGAGLAA